MSVELSAPADLPAAFRDALSGFAAAPVRPEVRIRELPAPQRLAPFAVAVHAAVTVAEEEVADGRLVVLHDPDGQDVWAGTTRCVAYLQAEVEPEIAADPMLPSVAWTWLIEALDGAGAQYDAQGGTVTRTNSERFGALSEHPVSCDLEIRASWSPRGDLGAHLSAFSELLCVAAGLPPMPPGVVPIPAKRVSRRTR